MMTTLKVGEHVRHWSIAYGWRFGRIIGRHVDSIGINPTGLEMATVRFPVRTGLYGAIVPAQDMAVACFLLERIDNPSYADPQPNQMAY